MPPQFPSIQSFFQAEISPSKSKAPGSPPTASGDGFTVAEVEATMHPVTLPKWQPRVPYDDVDIASLCPGPRRVALMGRIVNFYDLHTPSKKPHAAKGCLKLMVKDDTGVLDVKLWYDKMDYKLRLGQLVSIWAPHISNSDASTMARQTDALVTSIFPENDNSCYFLVQENSDDGTLCKAPLGYCEGKQMPGLMTLKSFVEGGSEALEAKILVCIKSIGGRKTFTTKKGNQAEKVDIGVFDDTFDVTLQLWNSAAASAGPWKPSNTVLLLTKPGLKAQGKPVITIQEKTQVEVDPFIADAFWLRNFGQSLTKREHVNQDFPEGVFDMEAALGSERRVLFTLADIDEFARAAPNERFMGWLSLILLELNIMSLHQRGMMFCTECCGLPLFANTHIGTLVDETGTIACGKLIWSPAAWEQLLGRSAEELAQCKPDVLKYMEHRLLFLRFSLLFGWSQEVERKSPLSGTRAIMGLSAITTALTTCFKLPGRGLHEEDRDDHPSKAVPNASASRFMPSDTEDCSRSTRDRRNDIVLQDTISKQSTKHEHALQASRPRNGKPQNLVRVQRPGSSYMKGAGGQGENEESQHTHLPSNSSAHDVPQTTRSHQQQHINKPRTGRTQAYPPQVRRNTQTTQQQGGRRLSPIESDDGDEPTNDPLIERAQQGLLGPAPRARSRGRMRNDEVGNGLLEMKRSKIVLDPLRIRGQIKMEDLVDGMVREGAV